MSTTTAKTAKPKLTTIERRALAMCEDIRASVSQGGAYPIHVEWVKSRTWGHNPRILHRGEKVTDISGCGYCKHSACLAAALCNLAEDPAKRDAIAAAQGAGVNTVTARLAEAGYILDCVASGDWFDAYTVRKA